MFFYKHKYFLGELQDLRVIILLFSPSIFACSLQPNNTKNGNFCKSSPHLFVNVVKMKFVGKKILDKWNFGAQITSFNIFSRYSL